MNNSNQNRQQQPYQSPKLVRCASDKRYKNLLFNLTEELANDIRAKLPPGFQLLPDTNNTKKLSKYKQNNQKSQEVLQLSLNEESKTNLLSQQSHQKSPTSRDLPRDKRQRMLSTLKKFKCSWPFKEPVNPVAMGIPQYFDIIRQPMDLETMSKKLSQGCYNTDQDFFTDIQLIITNSFLFNKGNRYFESITAEFQKNYLKLKSGEQSKFSTPKNKRSETPKQKNSNFKKTDSIDYKQKIDGEKNVKQIPKQKLILLLKQMFGEKYPCDFLDISKMQKQDLVKLKKYWESSADHNK